jgi:hypothetical protein
VADYLDPQIPRSQIVQPPVGGDTGGVTPAPKEDIVHLRFIPSALQIPIDSPAFTEGVRTVMNVPGIRSLLNDPNPAEPLKLDAVSLVTIIATGASATFGVLFSVLKVVGILALIL